MQKIKDLTGARFGRWVVKGLATRRNRTTYWDVRCDCGVEREVSGGNLTNGKSLSCGCLRVERSTGSRAPRGGGGVLIDITGRKFGRWTVLGRAPYHYGSNWFCVCECGVERVVGGSNLKSGKSSSCGCLHRERASAGSLEHGLSDDPVYACWQRIRNRCFNQNDHDFHHYGGRGITICERWRDDPAAFYADMAPTWAPGLTIDRIDVNGHYEPANCRWITQAEQTRNKRNNVFVETPWGRMVIADAAKRSGVPAYRLYNLKRKGASDDEIYRVLSAGQTLGWRRSTSTAASTSPRV